MDVKSSIAAVSAVEKNLLFLTKRSLNSPAEIPSDPEPSSNQVRQRFTFKKKERLSGKSATDELFLKGKAFSVFPLRVYALEKNFQDGSVVKVLMGAPKSKLPGATDRNKAKRLMREAFRRNKLQLYSVLKMANKSLAMGYIYQSDKIISYPEMEAKIIVTLERLVSLYGSR